MKKQICISLFFVFFACAAIAQDSIIKNGYNVYHYPNGKVSSEGYMRNGEPDGYWKTYFENGILKSEGNRKNFLLDSAWKFYGDSGKIVREINYKEGKKNGPRKTYLKDLLIEENFKDDVKNGWTKEYFADGVLKSKVFFENGNEEGTAREYAHDGTVINLTEYKKGYILSSENINRYRSGFKHGKWKTFYENENLKEEGTYNYGKKDGYFKQFDIKGNLTEIRKYDNDVEIYDAPELTRYEIRKEYYKSGKIKTVTSYKDDIPEGIRREYDQQGNVKKSYVFKSGIVVGEGIVDENGLRQGAWKEFYESGEPYGDGLYKDGKRLSEWKFYHKNGNLEQVGKYGEDGKPYGLWMWYFPDGNIKRQENLVDGISDGLMTEYSDSGNIVLQGKFVEGEEDGEWIYEMNDYKEIGTYQDGKREGMWKAYEDGKLYFEGNYVEDQPEGLHVYYWDNGKIREKGKYNSGRKEGDWITYDRDGFKELTITYFDGEEVSYNGVKIDSGPEK